MELSGDLSDFALTDILQILSLSGKSGTVSLESQGLAGAIVIDRGKITHASVKPGESAADRLVREGLVARELLAHLKQIGKNGSSGFWTLKDLLLESGVVTEAKLDSLARRHIHETVAYLVSLEKGRFGIALNEVGPTDAMEEFGIGDGLDISEVLLGAAKEMDESSRDLIYQSVDPGREFTREDRPARSSPEPPLGATFADFGEGLDKPAARNGVPKGDRASRLCSLLAELRSHSFEAEVSLLIMRYASEVATRGVLFVVRENEICGLGQFGVEHEGSGHSPDEKVREIRIPIGSGSVFDRVCTTGQPFIGHLPENYWHTEVFKHIGGNGVPLSVFALPLVCNDTTIFIYYGDNFPGTGELTGVDELVALVNQASVVLEKIVLERLLEEKGVFVRKR